MIVREAKKYIEEIDKTIKEFNKILDLCSKDKEQADWVLGRAGITTSWIDMMNISINSMVAYKNILKDRIENAELS